MRILLVDPGADVSTSDVYHGLLPALRRQGVEVVEYPLAARINRVTSWLNSTYRRARKQQPDITPPTYADVLYLAAERALPIALMHQVDWVLVLSSMFFLKHWLILLKRAGLRVGLLLTESPYDDAEQVQIAPCSDIVWTNERLSVDVLKQAQPNTHYLPHAFDPEKHHPTTDAEDDAADVPAHDVVFVGTGFPERIELLSAVDWTGIDLGLYGMWKALPARHTLRQYVRGGLVPNTMASALYRRAKIGLNLYRQSRGFDGKGRIEAAESLNPRALELAACGVFSLSEWRAEVAEVTGPLVPTFSGPVALQAQLRRFLPADDERRRTAAALPARVADRTFDTMARQVVGDLGWTMATQGERVK